MKGILALIIIVGLIYLGYNLFFKETWQGFYYPNGCLVCEDDYIFSPIFNNQEECMNWGIEKRISRNNPNDTFECGLNCKKEGAFFICKETIDY